MYVVICGTWDNTPSASVSLVTPVKSLADTEDSATGNWWTRVQHVRLWAVLAVESRDTHARVDVLSVHDREADACAFSRTVIPRPGVTVIVRPVGQHEGDK